MCVCVCARSALGAVTCQRTHDFLAATPVDASSWRSPCATSRVKEARGAKRHIRRPRLGMRLLVSEIVRSAQSQTLRRCWARRGTRAHITTHTQHSAHMPATANLYKRYQCLQHTHLHSRITLSRLVSTGLPSSSMLAEKGGACEVLPMLHVSPGIRRVQLRPGVQMCAGTGHLGQPNIGRARPVARGPDASGET